LPEPRPDRWTIDAVLRWASDDFRGRGIETPRLDAELLLSHALSSSRIGLIVDAKRPLSADELARFRELVKRRRGREPIAYILGHREFYGRTFRVDRRVLIPRPDTEVLVETALLRTQRLSMVMRALDLCTGSGCVAITLARERPTAFVVATDASEDALAVARDNALHLGAYNVVWRAGDLFGALVAGPEAAWRFDLVTANAPYVASREIASLPADVRDHEPRVALEGGPDGLDIVRRIVAGAPGRLRACGILAVEVGAGQAHAAADLFARAGFVDIAIARDYARIERVVSGMLHTV
jgi:release factor glutamine methyltransferase